MFHYDENNKVLCTDPRGQVFQVAEAINPYWANAIALALNQLAFALNQPKQEGI